MRNRAGTAGNAGSRTTREKVRRRGSFLCSAFLSSVLFAAVGGAYGQTVPGPAEPRQTEEQPTVPADETSPLDVPSIGLPGAAPPGADQVRFTLADVDIEGMSVYPPEDVRALFADRVGQTVSLKDIFDIAAAIETRYRGDGYFLARVTVPAQRIEAGRPKLRVIEGYIDEVRVSGDVGPVRDLVQRYVDNITQSRPARLEDVERYLLLANDIPGITAQGVLQPGSGANGASQVVVNVERDWFSGYARVDNRESDFTGPWRAILAPGFNSFTEFGERVQATGVLAIDEFELGYAGLSAEGRIGDEGLKIGASVSYEKTEPGRFLTPIGTTFNVETDTVRASLAASYPVIRSRETNLWVRGGFDFADIQLDIDSDSTQVRDRMRVVWAGMQVDHRDAWDGASLLQVQLRQGLGFLGNTDGNDTLSSRTDAKDSFTSFRVSAARRQRITDELDLYVGGKAQFSLDPLLADEECAIGGETYGRGYDPGEIADDHCLAGTVELQYNPDWQPDFLQDYIAGYQIYGFYDVGKAWPENGDFDDGDALQSAGVGLRTQVTDWLRVDIEVAKPLTRERSADTSDRRMPQFFLGTVAQF